MVKTAACLQTGQCRSSLGRNFSSEKGNITEQSSTLDRALKHICWKKNPNSSVEPRGSEWRGEHVVGVKFPAGLGGTNGAEVPAALRPEAADSLCTTLLGGREFFLPKILTVSEHNTPAANEDARTQRPITASCDWWMTRERQRAVLHCDCGECGSSITAGLSQTA